MREGHGALFAMTSLLYQDSPHLGMAASSLVVSELGITASPPEAL
jgi:hypothetical protein